MTQHLAVSPHFLSEDDSFAPRPQFPLELTIVIDNHDAGQEPESPFTLNVRLGGEPLEVMGGALIGDSITEMLRALADAIEDGEVTR